MVNRYFSDIGSNNFENKVAVITGSSQGIGKAIAMNLARQGVKVVLNGRDPVKLERTHLEMQEKGHDVFSVIADIRYANQCERLINEAVKQYGQIDILVNNAAISSRGSVEKMAVSNIQVLIDTNYVGCAYMSKYAIPYLDKTNGNLIFINSVAAYMGMPYNTAYSSSKMAQTSLAEGLRMELLDSGIHVGIAYVGFTENDPFKTILDEDGSWIYLPQRDNINLDTREHVAARVFELIRTRRRSVTLTSLGHFTNFVAHHLRGFAFWLVKINLTRIKRDFTYNGEREVIERPY